MILFRCVALAAKGIFLCLCFGAFLIVARAQVPSPVTTTTPIPVTTPPPTNIPEPPPVAPTFQAPIRALPSAERTGVDTANQLSLTIDQAIEMALKNNNSIDVSRNNIQINEFNLRAARGVYDPLLTSQHFYESVTTPTASRIGGADRRRRSQRSRYSEPLV